MNFIILFILLVSISAHSGYMSEPELEQCNTVRTVYLNKSQCELVESEPCYKLPEDYRCGYHRVTTENDDDLSKPKFTKNEIEVCSGESDCETKLLAKNCTDIDEVKFINGDYTELYCSKQNGYKQKMVTRSRADAGLKAAFLADKTAKDAAKKAKKDKATITLKDKLEAGNNLSTPELREMLLYLLSK